MRLKSPRVRESDRTDFIREYSRRNALLSHENFEARRAQLGKSRLRAQVDTMATNMTIMQNEGTTISAGMNLPYLEQCHISTSPLRLHLASKQANVPSMNQLHVC